jgi:two-component system, cell cycle sensor histidine kinase and response regulator CckA
MSSTHARLRTSMHVERLPLVTYTLLLEPPFPPLYVSPQLESLFGYPAADCLADGAFWPSRVAEDDLPAFGAALARLRETHEPMMVEYRVTAKDGREVWVRDVGVVALEDDGELYVHGYLTDITHEKALERELAAERAQAAAFFRDSPVGLGISDAEGRYIRVNDALARLNGATMSDLVGRTLAEVSPDVAALVNPILAEVQRTGVPVRDLELEVVSHGVRRVALASFFPIETESETQYGRLVMDITEQRRAEAQRAVAEQQYRGLIEQLPFVTYVNQIEPSYRTTFVSPQIEELFGYAVAEWLSDVELWNRIVHPADLAIVQRAEAEARDRHEPFELEYRVVRRDGSVGWILDRMETIYDADGVAQSERGFLIDVTERRETEQMFRAVFDNAFEAVLLLGDDGCFVDANSAASTVFGLSRDELLGRAIGGFVDPGPEVAELWREFLSSGEMTGSYVLIRADGRRRDIEYSAKAHVLPGRHLAVLRDVTEPRALERELSRANKLESVGRLAGGVAHDFNNMLTAIRGYAQLLVARSAPGSPEHHDAVQIGLAAGRAADLTAQLLALGRRQTLQSQVVDLNELVQELGRMAGRIVGDTVEVTYDLDPGLCRVRVDPAQIQQVLLNLMANAADATGAHGSIVVRTANAEAGADGSLDLEAGGYAVVSVEDFGAGLDDSAIENLFDPFFTTKEVGRGLGLGLAASYGIAKQSGGTIVVDSVPGRGSIFSVYVPSAAETAAPERVTEEPDSG